MVSLPQVDDQVSGSVERGQATAALTFGRDEGAGLLAKFHAPEVVFGVGSLAEAGHAARRLGARRPFVVSDPGLIEAGWPAELVRHLEDASLQPVLWSDVTPNPKDSEVHAAYASYREHGGDVIIAIGGGSCIDAAKAVAVLSSNGGRIGDYAGVDQITRPIPPLLMIPSTAGTGADVSQFCIITDTTRRIKLTIMGRALVPDISITDPRLLTTMPDDLGAATGLDALTHGIESYVSLAHNHLADVHAIHAVELVFANLHRSLSGSDDLDPRTCMSQAALQAGLAFTNAILGATHAMSHQVGGLLDAPHGVVNAILLPTVIRFNAPSTPERFVHLARAAGIEVDPDPVDVELAGVEAADALAEKVRSLADLLGIPKNLRAIGVSSDDLPTLAKTTLNDSCVTTNPRATSEHEVLNLFRSAL